MVWYGMQTHALKGFYLFINQNVMFECIMHAQNRISRHCYAAQRAGQHAIPAASTPLRRTQQRSFTPNGRAKGKLHSINLSHISPSLPVLVPLHGHFL